MFWGAGGAGFSTGFGAGAGLAAGIGFTVGFGEGGFFAVEDFFAAGFFVAETFFLRVDFAAGLAAGFLDAVFFTAGLDAFLTGADFVFFTGFAEDLLVFTAAGFLDGLTVLFDVFFFDVSFFTINTSFENLIRKNLNNA